MKNKIIELYLAAYKALKAAESKLKDFRKRLEIAFPKGSPTLAEESAGQLLWQARTKRSPRPEKMPAVVQQACTVREVSLKLLDSWIELNEAKIRKNGWDVREWWTEEQDYTLVPKVVE